MGIKRIKLTQGKFAIIDACDYEWLSQWKWHYAENGKTGKGYARRKRLTTETPPRKSVYMHNVIAGQKGIDHKNQNGLDNRRKNLRLANTQQNAFNRVIKRKPSKNPTGVYLVRRKYKGRTYTYIVARIKINYKSQYLGSFKTMKEASEAYQKAAKRLHGKFLWNYCHL